MLGHKFQGVIQHLSVSGAHARHNARKCGKTDTVIFLEEDAKLYGLAAVALPELFCFLLKRVAIMMNFRPALLPALIMGLALALTPAGYAEAKEQTTQGKHAVKQASKTAKDSSAKKTASKKAVKANKIAAKDSSKTKAVVARKSAKAERQLAQKSSDRKSVV